MTGLGQIVAQYLNICNKIHVVFTKKLNVCPKMYGQTFNSQYHFCEIFFADYINTERLSLCELASGVFSGKNIARLF